MGACLIQGRIGFVFSPIEQPQAFRMRFDVPERWIGHEREMYRQLEEAIATHVAIVNQF